jgi:hypothetical protein
MVALAIDIILWLRQRERENGEKKGMLGKGNNGPTQVVSQFASVRRGAGTVAQQRSKLEKKNKGMTICKKMG